MEKTREPQSRTESKARAIEQINSCLRSGDYARALDLVRGASAQFPNDAELSELEKCAEDGTKRRAEADRLITESQELFARQKSAEAIQVLRKAYELDKRNSLARTILANALVEHAQSIVDDDWLEAEKLSNQALALNPAHPTAKTILNVIVQKKETSPVDEWVAQASKLHSSGDLFAALAWVAEGLAVHPHDAKLLQVQDAVQKDQEARRRQARRGDLDDLRRMQGEIAGANDAAAKQALVERIQGVAAKHWTDGEILSIANALLLRLGMLPQEGSTGSARRKGGTVIFHVPRPGAPETPRSESSEVPTSKDSPTSAAPPVPAPTESVPVADAPPAKIAPTKLPSSAVAESKVARATSAPQLPPLEAKAVPAVKASESKTQAVSSSPRTNKPAKSTATTAILVSAGAVILVIGTFFFTRRHYAPPIANTPSVAPPVAAPIPSTPTAAAPAVSGPSESAPEPAAPVPETSSDAATGKTAPQPAPAEAQGSPSASARDLGTLVVVAGQDGAKVSLNGKVQRQLTQSGQLRLPNLEPRDYFVQVSKSGFQDPPQQKVRIRNGEQARLTFNLQPQPPRMSSLTIQGGAAGTTVSVDQNLIGTIQPDGTLSVASVNPGDHVIELRKDRFKTRQLKKHFVAGGTISLAAAEAALEAAGGQLKITFAPPDAKVAIVKGDQLTIVNSGVPLNLAPGTYTLTARTADRFTRSSTVEVTAGQSKNLDLSLAPNGMSKWEDPGGWKPEGSSFSRKGGDFVLYSAVPSSGTFVFSAMPTKGRQLQWVLNYSDPRNYVLFQMDENNFYRSVIRNGAKSDEIIVPHKADKKSFRTLNIRVTATEIVHQIKNGDSWMVLDRWMQPGVNLSLGKFGFYIPGNDQVALSSFVQYADLNIR